MITGDSHTTRHRNQITVSSTPLVTDTCGKTDLQQTPGRTSTVTLPASWDDSTHPLGIAYRRATSEPDLYSTDMESCPSPPNQASQDAIPESTEKVTRTRKPRVSLTHACKLPPHSDNVISATVNVQLPNGKLFITVACDNFRLAPVGRIIVTPGGSQLSLIHI